jgi:hypothetical protein
MSECDDDECFDDDEGLWRPHPVIDQHPYLPLVDELAERPDDVCSWVWPDGRLHPEPPLPVALIGFMEAGESLPVNGWWRPVEAPPCGAVRDVPPEATRDGQRRRYSCDRRAGHPVEAGLGEGEHRAVTCLLTSEGGGRSQTWQD